MSEIQTQRDFFKSQIVAECKRVEPSPEHGSGQYAIVIDHLLSEQGPSFFDDMTLREAVDYVLGFMESAR